MTTIITTPEGNIHTEATLTPYEEARVLTMIKENSPITVIENFLMSQGMVISND